MSFAYPWVLALVPVLGFLLLAQGRRRCERCRWLRCGSGITWGRAGRATCGCCVCCGSWAWLLVVALARPQAGTTRSMQVSEGIAIQLLVDVSSSMDMSMEMPGGERRTRMEVAKELVEAFIAGDGEQAAGAGWRPDRPDHLRALPRHAQPADLRASGPAADGAGAWRCRTGRTRTGRPTATPWPWRRRAWSTSMRWTRTGRWSVAGEVASRVIVLLTDGENNSGNHLPLEAAGLAKKWGCKVYCISLGDQPPEEGVPRR